MLSLSSTSALIVGLLLFGSDGRDGPSGTGNQSRVGIVLCGSNEDGSWSAYAIVSRNAGRFDKKGMTVSSRCCAPCQCRQHYVEENVSAALEIFVDATGAYKAENLNAGKCEPSKNGRNVL